MAVDVGGASNIETLGIRTELVDNEVAAQQLKELGATGEATAAQIATAHKAAGSQIAQSYTDSVGRSRQVVEQQLAALTQLSAGITGAGKQATDMASGLARGLREQADAGRLSTAQIEQLTIAEAALAGEARAATTAVEQQAVANAASGRGVQVHGLQLGRLNQELGTFIGRLTGTNTAVTRLAAQVGGAVVGYGSMIAVLGGVALALGLAEKLYDHITEAARKAREEQEKLLKTFDEIAARAKTSETATTRASIGAEQAVLSQLRAQLAAQQAAARTAVGGYTGAGVASGAANPFGDGGAAQAAKIKQTQQDIALVEAQLTALVRKGAEDRDRVITSDLANIVRSGQATATQIANARALLAGYEQSLTSLQKAHSGDTATIVDLIEKIKQLNDALNPKQRVGGGLGITGPSVEQQAALDGLIKQAEELRRVAHEDNAQALAAQQAAAAVGLQGQALAIYNAHAKAAQETQQAYATLAGPALALRLEDVNATEAQAVATAKQTQAVKDSIDQLKANEAAQQAVSKIGQHNAEITKVETAEFERLAATVERDVLGAFTKLAMGGTLSFRSLVEAGGSLALRLVSQFDRGIAQLHGSLAEAIKAGAFEQEKAITRELSQLESLKKLAGEVGAAFAAAQLGYQFGQQSPTVAGGAIGGAVSGAAIGAETAGPLGAAIGALAGAATGLIGAAEAHRRAADALKDAAKQIEQGLAAFGTTNSVQQALNANQSQYLQLETAIVTALKAGIKSSVQQGQNPGQAFATAAEQLAKLESERAANAQRISDDFWTGITQQINAMNGPAGAFQNALIETDKKFRDNIESARALGATDAQLAAIEALRAKTEQQLREAEAERLAQLQLSLDAREAYAKGLTDEGKAIERRAEEEKQLFDAQAAGYTDAQLAQLAYIQSLEDAAAAAAKATEIQREQQDLSVRALRAQGLNAQADQAAFAYQQAREVEDAIKAGMDPATLVMLQLVQALEASAFAAEQLRQAMQQARSDIARDVQLGFTTPAAAIEQERQALGFGGLTNEQIRAQYTPYTGTALTPEQEAVNANIAQFFQDLSQFMGTGGVAQAATRTQAGNREAVVNAAQALTEVTGNRMADYLDSINVKVGQLVDLARHGSSVAAGAIPLAAAGMTQSVGSGGLIADSFSSLTGSRSLSSLSVPLFQPQPIAPQTSGGATGTAPGDLGDVLTQWFTGKPKPSGSPPTAPVITISIPSISVNVQITEPVPNALALARDIGDTSARQLAKKLAPSINDELARLTFGQRLRDGDPTKAG